MSGVAVRVPASSANLGPGFDVLAVATVSGESTGSPRTIGAAPSA